jgi:ribonuclease P protein component
LAANKFRDKHQLKRRTDFEILKLRGRQIKSTHGLLANIQENKCAGIRVGWTVPSYVGSSVTRNRLKRWMREYIRGLPAGFLEMRLDVNVVFRRRPEAFYANLEHRDLDEALKQLFKNINAQDKGRIND